MGHAAQQFQKVTNSLRLYNGHLLCVHRSASDAVEDGARVGTPADVCSHLVRLAEVHLEAGDPVGALAPILRCLSAVESARLLHYRAEALVQLAKAKLEMGDLTSALQLAEQVTPELGARGSARLRGDALMVQADVLLALAAAPLEEVDEKAQSRLVAEAAVVLDRAAAEFEAVVELAKLRHCHYLLARAHHQLDNSAQRDKHAAKYRKICGFLEGDGSYGWEDLGLAASSALHVRAAAAFASPTSVAETSLGSKAPGVEPAAGIAAEVKDVAMGGCDHALSACPAVAQLLALAEATADQTAKLQHEGVSLDAAVAGFGCAQPGTGRACISSQGEDAHSMHPMAGILGR